MLDPVRIGEYCIRTRGVEEKTAKTQIIKQQSLRLKGYSELYCASKGSRSIAQLLRRCQHLF